MHRALKIFLSGGDVAAPAAFSPLDVTPLAWWDPSDLTTLFQDSAGTTPVVAHNDPVGLIQDKSGNGNHLTQATAGARLTYQTDGTLHWLLGDGSADFASRAAMTITDGSGHHSSILSVRPTSVTGAQSMLDADNAGARLSQILRLNTTAIETIAFNTIVGAFTDAAGTAVALNEDFVASQLTEATAVESFKNGVGNGSTAVTGTLATGAVTVSLGSRNVGADQFFAGRIYQVVMLARSWTAGEHANLVTYCGAKAGLTV